MKSNLKKTLCFAFSSLLLLSACSQSTTQIKDSDEVLFTVGDQSFTRGEEYDLLKKYSGSSNTILLATNAVLDAEIGHGKKIQEEANKLYEESDEKGEEENKDDYIENIIIPMIQQEKLMDQYFKDQKKEIKKEYKPTIAKVLMCDNKDDAKNALKALQEGTDAQTVWDQYSSEDSTFKNEEIVVSTCLEDSLPDYVINSLYSAKEEGVIDEVMTDEDQSSGAYYVGVLISKDYDKNIDKIKTDLVSNSNQEISNNCLIYYLQKHGFEIHDQEIFDALRVSDPEYLVNHPELTEEEDQ